MTDQELVETVAKVEIKAGPLFSSMNRYNPDWKKLFDFYNQKHETIGLPTLGMGCMPCYAKVFSFVKEYLKFKTTDGKIADGKA